MADRGYLAQGTKQHAICQYGPVSLSRCGLVGNFQGWHDDTERSVLRSLEDCRRCFPLVNVDRLRRSP